MTSAIKIVLRTRALLAAAALVIPLTAVAEQPSEPVPGIDEDQTLSEQLDENKGVIEPPPVGDAGIHAPAPDPPSRHHTRDSAARNARRRPQGSAQISYG